MSDGEDEQSNARDVCPVRCQRSVNVCGRIGYRRAPPVLQPRAGDTASCQPEFTGHSCLIRSRDSVTTRQVHSWPFSESAHYPVSRGRKKSHFETRLLVRNMRARRSPDPPGGRSLGVSCTQSGGSACITAGSQEKVNWNGFSLRLRASRDVIRKVGNSDAMGVNELVSMEPAAEAVRAPSRCGVCHSWEPKPLRTGAAIGRAAGATRVVLDCICQCRFNLAKIIIDAMTEDQREPPGTAGGPVKSWHAWAGTSAAMAILI